MPPCENVDGATLRLLESFRCGEKFAGSPFRLFIVGLQLFTIVCDGLTHSLLGRFIVQKD
jgi:hypothetical protein